jgi:(p)ppGpp synthase/HD superfamily hydrolase
MAGQVLTASAERHHELFDRLMAEVAAYKPDVDRDLLERAYAFASEAHEHQQRRSGGDFILHALGVALILAEDTEGWRPLAESPAFAAALREEPAAEAA